MFDQFVFAQAPPAVSQPVEPAAPQDMIEIIGQRATQVQKIDRRAFRVKQNPHSAQADGLQLLRGLPAVTVTPDDDVQLLGASNVNILVDGKPIRISNTQFLRTLHGNDVERIEIITNPSAEFSPEGTGGAINFVLRRKTADGTSGTVSGELTNEPRTTTSLAVKSKHGKWAWEAQAQLFAGREQILHYHKLRSIEPFEGGPQTVNTEDGNRRFRGFYPNLTGKLTYDVDDRSTLSAQLFGGGGHAASRSDVDYVGLTPDFASFSSSERSAYDVLFRGISVDYDHKGKKDGETLKAAAALFGNPREDSHSDFREGSTRFTTDRRNRLDFYNANVDWQHPIGKDEILSLGASANGNRQRRESALRSDGSDPDLGPDFDREFSTRVSSVEAHGTFQQRVGSWTVMPGLRAELYHRRVSSAGFPARSVRHLTLYPSFHLDHSLSKTLDLTASYSRRVDRANPDDLRPYPIVTGVLGVSLGNPGLRDQKADAYEINLHFHRKQIDAGIILYDRETYGVWSNSYSTDAGGANVVQLVNAGHKSDRGAQIDLSTPLTKQVKLSASVNFFDSRVPLDPLLRGGHQESFRTTGNATLEWDRKKRGAVPGDVGQVQLEFHSAEQTYQIREHAWFSANVSYTRSLTRTLSMTGSANGIGVRRVHTLDAPLIQEYFARRRMPPVLKIKLTKTLGKN